MPRRIVDESRVGRWSVFRDTREKWWPYRCEIYVPTNEALVEEIRQFNVITFGPLGGDVSRWRYSVVISAYSIKAGFTEEKERLVFLLRWSDLK